MEKEKIFVAIQLAVLTSLILLSIWGFISRRNKKRRPLSTSDINDNDQMKINHNYVMLIIQGHYENLSKSKVEKLGTLFKSWQIEQRKISLSASKGQKKFLQKLMSQKDFGFYKEKSIQEVPINASKIFSDVFTEPFPSLHDMSDWAIATQIANIFTLTGISQEESKKYVVHVKDHFVNHKMVQGIILFDVYKTT